MTTVAVIACAVAAVAFFAWHIVDCVADERKQTRKTEEVELLKKELRNALETGNVARACLLRKRLLDLTAE